MGRDAWLRQCMRALAVSRHGCTPAYPTAAELEFFMKRGVVRTDLRNDGELGSFIGRCRSGAWPDLRVFAFGHRSQFETLPGYTIEKGAAFKVCLSGAGGSKRAAWLRYSVRRPDRPEGAACRRWIGPMDWSPLRVSRIAASGRIELGPDCGGLSTGRRAP